MISKEVLAALSVRISSNTAGFSKGIKQAQNNMNLLKTSAASLGTALAGMFTVGAILKFSQASMEAYNTQIQAEKGLLNALNGREDIQQRLIRQASEIQNRSLYGDEQIIAQQKYLAALRLSERQIRDTIEAAVQLSSATGITLESAVRNLAKTYGGLTGELGELLPGLKELTQEQLKNGDAIAYVNKEFKGFAETAAIAGTGSIEQMKNAWEDVKEEWGKFIAPRSTNLAKSTKEELLIWQDETLSFFEKFWMILGDKRQKAYMDEYNKQLEEQKKKDEEAADNEENNAEKIIPLLQEKNEELKDAIKLQNDAINGNQLAKANRKVQILQEEIKALKELGTIPPPPKMPEIEMPKIEDAKIDVMDLQWDEIFDASPAVENMEYFVDGLWMTADEFAKFQQEMQAINSILESGIEEMVIGFAEGLGQLIATGKGFDASTILTPLADMAIQLGKLAIGTGITIQAIKDAFTKNPALAVVAGIALIALGTAIKASLKNMSNNIGGGSGISTNLPDAGSNINTELNRNIGERENQMHITIEGRLKGSDMLLQLQRANKDKNIRT